MRYETKIEKKNLAVLVALGSEAETASSLDELERLLETSGGECAAKITQAREKPDPKTFIGKGKCEEIKEFIKTYDDEIELVVFDDELSPSQIANLEDAIDCRVIDRTMLILDIFALHAVTAEGKLQVEIACLKYSAPRLIGKGTQLSRLGGGIGTRGPGETKLESDKRHIRRRIHTLEQQLLQLSERRERYRQRRKKDGIITAAIVGYTNAGKSTLLNTLTDADVLAENKLFATLDPTTRQFTTPNGTKLLLTDTVGFIRNLPHHLIKAFKSTLDEAVYSDILLIVVDSSDPEFISQTKVTSDLLEELGASGKPTVYVFNKCDACTDRDALIHMKTLASTSNTEVVFISAKTGAGCNTLVEIIERLAANGKHRVTLHIPVADGAITGLIYKDADDVDMDYREDGIYCKCVVDDKLYAKIKKYIVEE